MRLQKYDLFATTDEYGNADVIWGDVYLVSDVDIHVEFV